MADERITAALKTVGVPVQRMRYTGQAETFIVFQLLSGNEAHHSDDENHADEITYRINVYSRRDYTHLIRSVKQALRAAEFYGITEGPELYEEDTGFYHMPMEASFMREDEE
jgi:hypothetical protein